MLTGSTLANCVFVCNLYFAWYKQCTKAWYRFAWYKTRRCFLTGYVPCRVTGTQCQLMMWLSCHEVRLWALEQREEWLLQIEPVQWRAVWRVKQQLTRQASWSVHDSCGLPTLTRLMGCMCVPHVYRKENMRPFRRCSEVSLAHGQNLKLACWVAWNHGRKHHISQAGPSAYRADLLGHEAVTCCGPTENCFAKVGLL